MSSFLDKVVKYKNSVIRRDKRLEPLSVLKSKIAVAQPPVSMSNALCRGSGIIAEIKRRSPSKLFPKVVNCVALGQEYAANGACAISVLTDDKFFGGSLADLQQVRAGVGIPVLRKDFIIDEYQVYQSRAYGADAVLLIASLLSDRQLIQFHNVARSLGMEVLIEMHNEGEVFALNRMFMLKEGIIFGINNRDLSTLKVDLETARWLLCWVPPDMITIVESGISNQRQIREFFRRQADGFLIGGALLESPSPGKKLHQLIYGN